jgi:RNA polymerase sigma factor (sigma-70 family)
MRGGSSRDVLRQLRTLYRCGVVGPLNDEQLLDRFAARRDETAEEAFAELVHRHGPMVLGVCRRILGDAHEAEDAFQATFLVLARKAGSVLRREKVANWLYGVAVRTAKEARGRAARRRTREERVSTPVYVDPPDDECPDELRAILDGELARLPARYRGPVVLCELEGLSRPEAARRLDIPEGTLSSRLARAKAQLRERLARRGVTVPAVVLSTALLREARAVSLPISLIEATVEAATHVAAGASATAVLSASVASLSEGVLKAMLFAKLKGVALGIGVMTAVVSGAVVLAQTGPATKGVVVPSGYLLKSEKAPEAPPSDADRSSALEKKLDRILDALDRLSRPAQVPVTAALELAPSARLLPPPTTALVADMQPPPAVHPEPSPALSPEIASQPGPSLHAAPVPAPLPEPSNTTSPAPEVADTERAENEQEPSAAEPTRAEHLYYQVQVPKAVGPGRKTPGSITDRLNALEERMDLFEQVTKQVRAELIDLRKQVGGAPTPAPAVTTPFRTR